MPLTKELSSNSEINLQSNAFTAINSVNVNIIVLSLIAKRETSEQTAKLAK